MYGEKTEQRHQCSDFSFSSRESFDPCCTLQPFRNEPRQCRGILGNGSRVGLKPRPGRYEVDFCPGRKPI